MDAKRLNDSGVERLIIAIFEQAAKDYRKALRCRSRRKKAEAAQIKDFMTSGAYGVRAALGECICRQIERGL